MASIPAKVTDRIKENLGKIQKVIEQAKARDINEADTAAIVSEILTDIFGYDKYTEVTREYAIKSTYCDLAIKVENDLKFLIEVKAIGITLQDKHYQQALEYGANNGTDWIILTNSLVWRVYRVRFEKPIRTDFICEFNMLDLKSKNESDLDKLFILCKEGLKRNAIDEFSQYRLVVNRYFISAVLQSDATLDTIRKELRKINPLIKAEDEELLAIIRNEILKRDVLDTPDAAESQDKYQRALKKIEKQKTKQKSDTPTEEEKPEVQTEVAAPEENAIEQSADAATDSQGSVVS
jgi:hypothetical protein